MSTKVLVLKNEKNHHLKKMYKASVLFCIIDIDKIPSEYYNGL